MKCAGQDSRFWDFESIFTIPCPHCDENMEFFKDDTNLTCKKCGHAVLNPKIDFGCASYCKFAEQCLGTLPPELLKQRQDLLKDRLALEVKRYLGRDFKSISRIVKIAHYSESICKKEKGNLGLVLAAAYLSTIEIPQARKILLKLHAEEKIIDNVCMLLNKSTSTNEEQNIDARILHDAARLTLLKEKTLRNQEESPGAFIEKEFLTETGQKIAKEIVLKN